MNVVDLVIIAILAIGALVGFKRGLFPQLISLVGFIFVVIGSFVLKNYISEILYDKLPFFSFGGVFKGVTIVNILLYEIIAFTVVMVVLLIVFKIVMKISKVFEKLFDIVLLFEVPSKIIGAILGILENYLVVFIVLYIATLPFFNIDLLKNSKLRENILEKTPVLSDYAESTVEVGEELWSITKKYQTAFDANAFNLEALDILLKYDITTVDSIDKLVEKDKIKINGIETVLSKYRN